MNIEFYRGELTAPEQSVVLEGFRAHSEEQGAPSHSEERVKWLGFDERDEIKAVLTAVILWDWIYIDELWVCATLRGKGVGRRLILLAEEFCVARGLEGIWLWTQSWQAEGFYRRLGYEEFTRFQNFPRGYTRIGFRKPLASRSSPPQR